MLITVLIYPAPTAAQEVLDLTALAAHHPWARYGVGSWKKVRVTTETYDESGKLESTSITETKTTLVAVDRLNYTLRVDVSVEVAGRRFEAEPKQITQGLLGESAGQRVEIKQLPDGKITICGREYPCKMRQVTINGDGTKRVTVSHYSDDIPPYLLKSQTTVTDPDRNQENYESTAEVVALDMPFKVLTETKSAAYVRTLLKRSDGVTTSTIEVHCSDVPGAVVSHSSREADSNGRVIRRSTLELLDYETVQRLQPTSGVVGKRRLFQRLRGRTSR